MTRPKLTLIVCNDEATPPARTRRNERRHYLRERTPAPAMPSHSTGPDDEVFDGTPVYSDEVRKRVLAMQVRGGMTVQQCITELERTFDELVAAGERLVPELLVQKQNSIFLRLYNVGIEAGVYSELGRHELIVRVLYVRRIRERLPELGAAYKDLYGMPLR